MSITKAYRENKPFVDHRLAPLVVAACDRKYDQVSYYMSGGRHIVQLTKISVDPNRKRKPKAIEVDVTGMGKREMALAVLEAL